MEIRSINQPSQSTSELNVSTQTIGQEINSVNAGLKGSQACSDEKKITDKDVGKAVDKLNKLIEDKETHAEYELYGDFKDLTVRIVNNKTNEVVQEIPPRKLIDMVNKLCEMAGVFVDKKA